MRNKFFTLHITGFLLMSVMAFVTSCKKDNLNGKVPTDPNGPGNAVTKLTTAALPSTEPFQTVANGTFIVVNRKSGKVLDVDGYKTADGSNVWQYGGTGGANQKWTLQLRSGGYYSATDVNSGKGLQVDLAGTADGANVNISTYTGGTHQQWKFVAVGNGYYKIINRKSGKVLEVAGSSVDDLANVQQWTSNNGENQQWALLKPTYNGQLSWVLTSTGVPTDVQSRITAAMNDACARYNAGANWPARTLTVEYDTGVQTADGSINGNIRFGGDASYQGVRTAMHEIGHTYGVGGSSGWYSNTSSGDFLGANTVTTIHGFETATSAIHTGGGHFWPYGLNFDSEWSESNAYRHVKLIYAMRSDGM